MPDKNEGIDIRKMLTINLLFGFFEGRGASKIRIIFRPCFLIIPKILSPSHTVRGERGQVKNFDSRLKSAASFISSNQRSVRTPAHTSTP